MHKHRRVETAEQRDERHKQEARRKIEDDAAADDVLDARIRRNIELYGP